MAISAELKGRDALMRKLESLAVDIDKYAADAKLAAAEELAEAIRVRAPTGATLEYRESIAADRVSNRPNQRAIGIQQTKDPTAAGVYAEWIWHFLEFGTAPHNTAKGGGTKKHKGPVHMHPGTPAQSHIFPTYRAMKKSIRKRILAAVNKAVREAMRK